MLLGYIYSQLNRVQRIIFESFIMINTKGQGGQEIPNLEFLVLFIIVIC